MDALTLATLKEPSLEVLLSEQGLDPVRCCRGPTVRFIV
jgi:hypothetical protein